MEETKGEGDEEEDGWVEGERGTKGRRRGKERGEG